MKTYQIKYINTGKAGLWTLGIWTLGLLDSGRLYSGRLDAWTLDASTLDGCTLDPWIHKILSIFSDIFLIMI